MGARSGFSAQRLSALAAFCNELSAWRHGYALAQQTGLALGTLYPILVRLADRELVQACWQGEPQPGRPRRRLHRLTGDGVVAARTALAQAARRRRPAARRGARRWLAVEGGA